MKCKVIKEFAGIKEGEEMEIIDNLDYMVTKGYVKPMVDTKSLDQDYKTKVVEVPKNKGGRPSKQK